MINEVKNEKTPNKWKCLLPRILAEFGIITDKYTGQIIINFNQGGITDLEIRKKFSE